MSVVYSDLKAVEIVAGIRSREWKAEDVMKHFLQQAKEANDATNCVTEFLTEEALDAARDFDQRLSDGETYNEKDFPLLGLPISVKDIMHIKGHATVCGYKRNIGKKADEDSVCIRLLRECGAIPFCKTTVCQFCMTFESSNPITGTTKNPFNPLYSSGGSTSGEAPLIKLKGSVLGVGSDIGGSLRVPAHFCGIYTLKPTSPRIPKLGQHSNNQGQEMVKASIGPMANCVEDLELFMRSLLDKECWKFDPSRIPVPYRPFSVDKKLHVGYLLSDGIFPATPACQRAVMETINALSADGHTVKPFSFKGFDRIRLVGQATLLADCLSGGLSKLDGEGVDPTISRIVRGMQLPNWTKSAMATVLHYGLGQTLLAETISNSRVRSVAELWAVLVERQEILTEFNKQWELDGLDVLVLPPVAFPAFQHGQIDRISGGVAYSFLANVFDLPAGVIPVTQVDPKLDTLDPLTWYDDQFGPGFNPQWPQKFLYSAYDATAMAGLPVGVQVLGRSFEDEKVLAVMKVIEALLNKRKSTDV
ncbi:hypothetical protein DSO57_1024298 [Entomophthora muscae]|uniref:Uncharacterized protein n=1 Tax=Entomophthora muscae TaxID=34485 RepID=A0ACC2SFJ3_9FUNG|nr:hypothetical protein DSO57_1024298 [Entomophthora muscae]